MTPTASELIQFKQAKDVFMDLNERDRAGIISQYGGMHLRVALSINKILQARIFFRILFGKHRETVLDKMKQLARDLAV